MLWRAIVNCGIAIIPYVFFVSGMLAETRTFCPRFDERSKRLWRKRRAIFKRFRRENPRTYTKTVVGVVQFKVELPSRFVRSECFNREKDSSPARVYVWWKNSIFATALPSFSVVYAVTENAVPDSLISLTKFRQMVQMRVSDSPPPPLTPRHIHAANRLFRLAGRGEEGGDGASGERNLFVVACIHTLRAWILESFQRSLRRVTHFAKYDELHSNACSPSLIAFKTKNFSKLLLPSRSYRRLRFISFSFFFFFHFKKDIFVNMNNSRNITETCTPPSKSLRDNIIVGGIFSTNKRYEFVANRVLCIRYLYLTYTFITTRVAYRFVYRVFY